MEIGQLRHRCRKGWRVVTRVDILGSMNNATRAASDLARFQSKCTVDDATGCWLWTGHRVFGYGHFSMGGKDVRAHRAAWAFYRGAIPNGMFVCHRCDVPACCNPDHLFLGTPKDNCQDMIAKGRRAPLNNAGRAGAANHAAKLTEENVVYARRQARAGRSAPDIADELGVTRHAAHSAITGRTWGCVAEPTAQLPMMGGARRRRLG
jgi:hypothetical protein